MYVMLEKTYEKSAGKLRAWVDVWLQNQKNFDL